MTYCFVFITINKISRLSYVKEGDCLKKDWLKNKEVILYDKISEAFYFYMLDG